MFSELLKNVMNLGIITEDDVKRLTAIELMLLIIERTNGLLNFLNHYVEDNDQRLVALDSKYQQITDDIKKLIQDNETYFNEIINKNLQVIALAKLNEWLADGTLESLINDTLLSKISDRVSVLEEWKDIYIDETQQEVKLMARNVDLNSAYFRIPWMTVTSQGTIIAGCDVRYNSSADHSFIDLGYKRSIDGGKTWSEPKIAIRNKRVSSQYSRVMDGTILCDPHDNKIYLLGNSFEDGDIAWTQSTTSKDPNWDVLLAVSTDDGQTFGEPTSLRSLGGSEISEWLGGVGSGIVLSNGTLVFPIQVSFTDKVRQGTYNTSSGIIYSTNHGTTWQMCQSFVDAPSSECTIVEYDGKIILNARSDGNKNRRLFYTTDMGNTWVAMRELAENTSQYNGCQGHMIKLPPKANRQEESVIFSHPTGTGRNAIGLSMLNARMSRFSSLGVIYPGTSDGYSCLAYDETRDRLYCLLETGDIWFKDISYLLKYCNQAFTEDIIPSKFKANFQAPEQRQKVTIYVTGSKYGSNENDGLTVDRGWKDLSRLCEFNDSYANSIDLYIAPTFEGNLFIENINRPIELRGAGGSNIVCRKLYFRNTTMIKVHSPLDVLEPFNEESLLAFESTTATFGRVNIKPSLDFRDIVYADDCNLTIKQINYDESLLDSSEIATSTAHRSFVSFHHFSSNVSLEFMDKDLQTTYKLFQPASSSPTLKNHLTINNVRNVKDSGNNDAYLINLSTVGTPFRTTSLATGLEASSSGMPTLYARNSTVTIEADIVVSDFSQIISRSTVLFNIPPILRPTSKRKVTGYVGYLSGGNIQATYQTVFEINTNGDVKMMGRPETNDISMIEIFGTYELS